jgi:hypothetical protein
MKASDLFLDCLEAQGVDHHLWRPWRRKCRLNDFSVKVIDRICCMSS